MSDFRSTMFPSAEIKTPNPVGLLNALESLDIVPSDRDNLVALLSRDDAFAWYKHPEDKGIPPFLGLCYGIPLIRTHATISRLIDARAGADEVWTGAPA